MIQPIGGHTGLVVEIRHVVQEYEDLVVQRELLCIPVGGVERDHQCEMTLLIHHFPEINIAKYQR